MSGEPSHVLLPLAARYASWLGLPVDLTGDIIDEDPTAVRAMPLILRMERDASPSRTGLLEAAASAAVALCLEERSQPGGPWHAEVAPWVAGRIRKVSRRARGAHWVAVTDLPGVTVERGGAEVRALPPWLVAKTPRAVTRLQVGGTDLPFDDPGPPLEGQPVLWLTPEPLISLGKAAAQVGHASMLLAALLAGQGRLAALDGWAADGFRCAVRTASPAQWAAFAAAERPDLAWRDRGVLAVRDAGCTEVPPGTVTVAAHWPAGSAGDETGQRGPSDGGVGGGPERGQ